ncbi:MAG: multidrug effflux MFS transporter [Planctomycetes bacterium]|nr:multidrug effflux MFS transporter [Planctomycetota bacterium]
MTSQYLRFALVLGLLSSIGPFAIDMYLPALPAIGRGLGADVGMVQMSLMVYFAAIALSQLIYGPASDRFGRKPPLYVGLGLFVAGSCGCALAPSIESLIVWRVIQGLGGGATLVLPRAIVRDLHTGNEAARLMSLLMLVFSVSPILAPLLGSLVIAYSSWRGIFTTVTVIGVIGLALVAGALRETRPPEQRADSTLASVLPAYALLLRDRHFLGLAMIGAFGLASFFVYLGNSSFVLIEHYGLSPLMYGVAFSVNAASFIGVSQLTGVLCKRFGLERMVRFAVTAFAASMLLLLALFLGGMDRADGMAAVLFVGYGFLGLVVPATSVLALDHHGAIAGTASALMGTLHLFTGAVVMAIVGQFLDGTALPMVVGIALCAVVAMALAWATLRTKQPVLTSS